MRERLWRLAVARLAPPHLADVIVMLEDTTPGRLTVIRRHLRDGLTGAAGRPTRPS